MRRAGIADEVVRIACGTILLALGCDSPTIPEGGPGYTGEIQAVDPRLGTRLPGDQGLTKIWVRHADDECGLILSVREGQTVLQRADGREASMVDFTFGSTVDVWHVGLILDSCPMQTVAVALRLK